MTSAMSHKMAFGKAPKRVHTPNQNTSFDPPNWIEWFSNIAIPTIREVGKLSSAVSEPAKGLMIWQPRNGLVSSLESYWAAAPPTLKENVVEEDMLDALLTLDLTIPVQAHTLGEKTVRGRVLGMEKWSPTILDPEGFLDLED